MDLFPVTVAFLIGAASLFGLCALVERWMNSAQATHADYYFATWCAPCRRMKPHILKLKSEGYIIRMLDADTEGEGIEAVPTMVYWRGKTKLSIEAGYKDYKYLKSKFKEVSSGE